MSDNWSKVGWLRFCFAAEFIGNIYMPTPSAFVPDATLCDVHPDPDGLTAFIAKDFAKNHVKAKLQHRIERMATALFMRFDQCATYDAIGKAFEHHKTGRENVRQIIFNGLIICRGWFVRSTICPPWWIQSQVDVIPKNRPWLPEDKPKKKRPPVEREDFNQPPQVLDGTPTTYKLWKMPLSYCDGYAIFSTHAPDPGPGVAAKYLVAINTMYIKDWIGVPMTRWQILIMPRWYGDEMHLKPSE